MKLPVVTTPCNCEQTDRLSSIQLTLFFIQSINKLTLATCGCNIQQYTVWISVTDNVGK